MNNVSVKRSLQDWQEDSVEANNLFDLAWTCVSGGLRKPMSSWCISGKIFPDKAPEVNHSGSHRQEWKNHQPIRVIVVEKGTDRDTYESLKKVVGPKPGTESAFWYFLTKNMQDGQAYSFETIKGLGLPVEVSDAVLQKLLSGFVRVEWLKREKKNRVSHYTILTNNKFENKVIDPYIYMSR